MRPFSLEPIGFVRTCYPARFGAPRQPGLAVNAWGVVRLRPDLNLADALEGLEGFSHVWLIFVFHKNASKRALTKVHPPRLAGGKVGVLASRSPHRPNPIGLSAVKLERVEGNELHLSGVDLLDGTPILDIKPYLPFADAIPQAKALWAPEAPAPSLAVGFSDEALAAIRALRPERDDGERLMHLIEQTIALDPRAGFLKGTPERPNPYTDRYGFFLEDLNVVFRVVGEGATVLRVEPASQAVFSTTRSL